MFNLYEKFGNYFWDIPILDRKKTYILFYLGKFQFIVSFFVGEIMFLSLRKENSVICHSLYIRRLNHFVEIKVDKLFLLPNPTF